VRGAHPPVTSIEHSSSPNPPIFLSYLFPHCYRKLRGLPSTVPPATVSHRPLYPFHHRFDSPPVGDVSFSTPPLLVLREPFRPAVPSNGWFSRYSSFLQSLFPWAHRSALRAGQNDYIAAIDSPGEASASPGVLVFPPPLLALPPRFLDPGRSSKGRVILFDLGWIAEPFFPGERL